jgi:hypothetical protein
LQHTPLNTHLHVVLCIINGVQQVAKVVPVCGEPCGHWHLQVAAAALSNMFEKGLLGVLAEQPTPSLVCPEWLNNCHDQRW